MLVERVLEFIADPAAGDFDELVEEARAATGKAIDPRLHPAAVAASTEGLFAAAGHHPILALSLQGTGGSRLVDELLRARGDDASLRPLRAAGVDPRATRSWLAARQRTGRPVLVAGTDAALEQLVAPLERRGLIFRLPAGSAVLAVASLEPAKDDVTPRLVATLGLDPTRLWTAWEPVGGATPFLAAWSKPPTYETPHWTRVAAGDDGSLRILDLAALGAAVEVATGARGSAEARGFRIHARPTPGE